MNQKNEFSIQFYNGIKVFISLYKFRQQIINKENEALSGQIILLDKTWFSNYKKYYFCEQIFELIKENNLSDFDLTEQQLIFNSLFNDFYKSKSNEDKILFYDEEFPHLECTKNNKGTKIKFINNFEIINEEIYKNLLNTMGMFKYCNCNAKKYKYEIKDGKIIIKYKNDEEKCFNLLLGSIGDNTDIYIPEILINFPDFSLLQIECKEFIDSPEIKCQEYIKGNFDPKIVTKIEPNFNTYNDKVKFFIHSQNNYPDLGTYVQNQNNAIKKKLEKKNILKAFLLYYLNNQKMISNNINDREIKNNEKCYCFLINKSWMNKFKSLYNYDIFLNSINKILSNFIESYGFNGLLINDKNIEIIIDKIKSDKFFNNLDNLNEKKIIDDLRNKNLFLIEFNYDTAETKKRNYIKIYKNFEIITIEENNFIDILFPLFGRRYNKFQYLRNEENYSIFIDENNNEKVLNVCSVEEKKKEININLEIIIKGKKIDKVVEEIKNNSFMNYILSINFNENFTGNLDNSGGKIYLLNNGEGKIGKKLKEKEKLKMILFNFTEFIENLKETKKSKNQFNKEKFIYLAPKENIELYLRKYNIDYSEINEIINKKGELENRKKELTEYINKNFKFLSIKDEELKKKEEYYINKKEQIYILTNNNEKIYCYNNVILLDESIIKSMNFDLKLFTKLEYYKKEQYIFLFQQTGGNVNVHVGKLNNENVFKFVFLFNSTKDIEYILNIIDSKTMQNFYESAFVFKNMDKEDNKEDSKFSHFSLFFDDQYNIIGNAYKPKDNNNSIISCYDQFLINKIYLIIYFNFPKYQNMTLDSGKYYYLISENWLNTFKERNQIEELKNKIISKDNKINKENLQVLINVEQKDKKLLNKMICKLIVEFQNVIGKYNKNDFPNIPPEPDCSCIYDNRNYVYFYNNFFLLEEEIHNRIFDINEQQYDEMKKRNYYCKCFYAGEYIFVRLNKYITQTDKIIFEVGNLDNHVFKLVYLLMFNSENDFKYNFDLLRSVELKHFFTTLNFNAQNMVALESYNKNSEGGYIYKFSEDINKNINDAIFDIKSSINSLELQINLQNIELSLKEIFLEPPKIGLKNIGATCYMNATIQCFSQIEKLTLYFLKDPYIKEVLNKYKGKDCLSESFQELIKNLWPLDKNSLKGKYRGKNSNNDYYIPEKFKEKISKMNDLFKGAQANDSKDLVNFIVMQLHEELNRGSKLNNNQDIMQNDEMSIYNNFCQSCFQENNSIISNLFYGVNGTMYECQRCKTRKYNFQVSFFYIFPLEEVRQYKIRQNEQQLQLRIQNLMANNMIDYITAQNMLACNNIENQNISSVTLYDCFIYNQKIDYMVGENAMFCNQCQKTENCAYETYITNPPEIMIIVLNRGQGIQYKVKCEFSEYIDIGPYVRYSNNTPYKYKLIGVVTHMGESGANGHFVAFCRSPVDNKWYNYNDDLCFLVDNVKNKIIDYAMPYILFYQKE